MEVVGAPVVVDRVVGAVADRVVTVPPAPPLAVVEAPRSLTDLSPKPAVVAAGAAWFPVGSAWSAPVSQAVSTPPTTSKLTMVSKRRPARRGTGGAGGRMGRDGQ